MKTLTIVISCYNSTKTLKATLDSIPATGRDDFEVMIIDDGSTEDIYSIAKPFVEKYPRTMKYIRKENGGHGSCINYGIKNAQTRYISFLDSDDTYNPVDFNIVLSLLRRTQKNTDLVLHNFNMVFVNKNGNEIKRNKVSNTNKMIAYKKFSEMPLGNLFTLHSSIYSTEMLKKIYKMPEHVSYEDNILYYQALLRVKKIAYLNKLIHLYNYFIYGAGQQSISVNTIVKKFDHMVTVYKYALSIPIKQFRKSRDKIVRKMFNSFIGFILLAVSFNDEMTKVQKGKIARSVHALYADFLQRNPGRNIKPIVYTFFSKFQYGGVNWFKPLTKFIKLSFLTAVLHKPKEIKATAEKLEQMKKKYK